MGGAARGENNGELGGGIARAAAQAEGLIGFLDAYLLSRDARYLDAFRNLHTFVFEKMINWPVGEWFPLLDRQGNVLWDYMGHNWKICYHTVRAMCELVRRLEGIS